MCTVSPERQIRGTRVNWTADLRCVNPFLLDISHQPNSAGVLLRNYWYSIMLGRSESCRPSLCVWEDVFHSIDSSQLEVCFEDFHCTD